MSKSDRVFHHMKQYGDYTAEFYNTKVALITGVSDEKANFGNSSRGRTSDQTNNWRFFNITNTEKLAKRGLFKQVMNSFVEFMDLVEDSNKFTKFITLDFSEIMHYDLYKYILGLENLAPGVRWCLLASCLTFKIYTVENFHKIYDFMKDVQVLPENVENLSLEHSQQWFLPIFANNEDTVKIHHWTIDEVLCFWTINTMLFNNDVQTYEEALTVDPHVYVGADSVITASAHKFANQYTAINKMLTKHEFSLNDVSVKNYANISELATTVDFDHSNFYGSDFCKKALTKFFSNDFVSALNEYGFAFDFVNMSEINDDFLEIIQQVTHFQEIYFKLFKKYYIEFNVDIALTVNEFLHDYFNHEFVNIYTMKSFIQDTDFTKIVEAYSHGEHDFMSLSLYYDLMHEDTVID